MTYHPAKSEDNLLAGTSVFLLAFCHTLIDGLPDDLTDGQRERIRLLIIRESDVAESLLEDFAAGLNRNPFCVPSVN